MAGRAGVPFYCRTISGKSMHNAGMEAWARAERYAFFAGIMRQHGYDLTATGHTADDQAETVLLRLMRGAGLKGLSGIHARRSDGIVRPLLFAGRDGLLKWLDERGIAYRVDASNADTRFRRNMVRHRLLPALRRDRPEIVRHLSDCARDAAALWKRVRPQIDVWIAASVQEVDGRIIIRADALDGSFLARECLAELFRRNGIEIARMHIDAAQDRIVSGKSGELKLPGGWSCRFGRREIEIRRGGNAVPGGGMRECQLVIPGTVACGRNVFVSQLMPSSAFDGKYDPGNHTAFLDADAAGLDLRARVLRCGEPFHPFGRPGPLPADAFLKKQGLHRHERDAQIVIANAGGDIVWIPGVRVGHPFRTTPQTNRILRIAEMKAGTL
jgi:tRNA(Ile)-lysidine synthase